MHIDDLIVGPQQRGRDANFTSSVCFRVTRACNLKCPYCQAPENARQLTLSQLGQALSFFAERDTKRIKFTGGEPFVHRGILQLIENCRGLGMEPTVVTNGTVLPPGALDCLKCNRARVKVSLHGPRETHNAVQNQDVYDVVIANIRKLIAGGVETSIHTLLYRGSPLVLPAWIEFLAAEGIHKVSFMTFVSRGRGRTLKDQWQFGEQDLDELYLEIGRLTKKYEGTIIVRCLDFARKPYIVFETDGSLGWQVADESGDEKLLQVVPARELTSRLRLTAPPVRSSDLLTISQAAADAESGLVLQYTICGSDSAHVGRCE